VAVSKAYLRRLTRVVKDRETRAAIREFLIKHDEEINTNKLVITSNGDVFYEGTIGKVTFYKMWGKYQRRRKSSLTGKRFRKDKAFKGSRESAERFALGNKLASKLYKMVDLEKKAYKLFCFLKTRAIELIKEGNTVEETKEVLVDYLRSFGMIRVEQKAKEERVAENEVRTVTEVEANNKEQDVTCLEQQKITITTLRIPVTGKHFRPKFLRQSAETGGRPKFLRQFAETGNPVRGLRTGWTLVGD
jgi:hypothetical protein